jgi:acyl-CoA hydrolase
MNNYTIVRTEHLNHHGYLFGGIMLKWIDEFAWLVASRDLTGCTLVTIGMEKVAFKQRVLNGSILRFHIEPFKVGKTSITYFVDVYADEPGEAEEKLVFSNHVTFVRLDENGKKIPLPENPDFRSIKEA